MTAGQIIYLSLGHKVKYKQVESNDFLLPKEKKPKSPCYFPSGT